MKQIPPISHNHTHGGFTLIELLTVISIIGLLAAIIIPSVGKVRENAQRAKSASNIRSIAQAYATFSATSGRLRTIPADTKTIQDWAAFLAKEIDLNEASLYYIESDPLIASLTSLPLVVGSITNGAFSVDSEFGSTPLSYAVVAGVAVNAPASTTPLIFTRGLTTSGNWTISSPWGEYGGHIGFLDGHVKFYRDLSTNGGELVSYLSKSRTANINEAINSSAVIINNSP